jgi:hypothetical protein
MPQNIPSRTKYPPSTALGMRCMSAVFERLSVTPDFVPLPEICAHVEQFVAMSDWDRAVTQGGNIRRKNQLTFHSIHAARARLLEKHRTRGWKLADKARGQEPATLVDLYWQERLAYAARRMTKQPNTL